jgi:hypothetical protein
VKVVVPFERPAEGLSLQWGTWVGSSLWRLNKRTNAGRSA